MCVKVPSWKVFMIVATEVTQGGTIMEPNDSQIKDGANGIRPTRVDNNSRKSVTTIRIFVQWCFLFWVVGIGIRFGMFINSIESGVAVPLVSRPPGVEGFLPIGALINLKYWLISGKIHPVHPAALVIFLTVVLMGLFAKKSFCSWLCPVGTLSEMVHKLGRQ